MEKRETDILVIEDYHDSRRALVMVFEAAGYFVEEADSAESALVILCKRLPKLIVLDIRLPGMSGVELARILKSGDETRNIDIIALTGDPDISRETLDAGCDAFLVKPIDLRSIRDIVSARIGKRRKKEIIS